MIKLSEKSDNVSGHHKEESKCCLHRSNLNSYDYINFFLHQPDFAL